jgi:dTDP-4-dehydrorhamnose reductase
LHNFDLVPLTHADIEIGDAICVREVMLKHQPAIIINTAAFVRVDDCEDQYDKAFWVNALGARNVAVVAQKLGAKLVHISTDYIFGGEREIPAVCRRVNGDNPRPYIEFDTPVPLNAYGRSKLAGENLARHFCRRHFIIRASGLFGVAGSSGKGGNFVETMLKLAKERHELSVVNDQVFSPTYTLDLARKIAQLMTTECYGIFHITNRGACSWYEFTREILRLVGIKTPVVPLTSDQYPQKARRPRYSVLDNYHLRLLGLDDMRPWPEALKDYLLAKGHVA